MNEIEILTFIYEKLGGLGLGIIGSILFFFKNSKARSFQLYHLFEKHLVSEDPMGQYSLYMQQLKYWLTQRGTILVFEDKGRQAIFQDLVHIKFLSLHKHQIEFFTAYEEGKIKNGTELYDFFLDLFLRINEDITQAQRQKGIPEAQIEKYQLWQRPGQAFTMSQIESVAFSKSYKTVGSKIEAILNMLRQNMSISLVESERTLMSLNGQLTGVEYGGFICGPVQQ